MRRAAEAVERQKGAGRGESRTEKRDKKNITFIKNSDLMRAAETCETQLLDQAVLCIAH